MYVLKIVFLCTVKSRNSIEALEKASYCIKQNDLIKNMFFMFFILKVFL
jgi:hypothetical protein